MFFAISSETDRAKFSARSELSSEGKRPSKILGNSEKCHPHFFFELGICFLQFRLKRIVLNFQPDRSHPRGGNDLPKNWENPKSDTRMVIDVFWVFSDDFWMIFGHFQSIPSLPSHFRMFPDGPGVSGPFSERSGAVEVRKSSKFLKMFVDQKLFSVKK